LFTDNKKKKTKKNAHKVVVSLGPSFRAFRESSLSLYRDSSREIVLRVLVDLVYTYTGDASKTISGLYRRRTQTKKKSWVDEGKRERETRIFIHIEKRERKVFVFECFLCNLG
jgi:hypothetical protein